MTSFGGPLTGSPRWSPDGRTIAFDSRARGRSDVYLVDSEGGPPLRLVTERADSQVPFWSPDGEWLYFSAPLESGPQVFKVPRQGGQATQLTTRGGSFPQAAPDGGRIYYWSEGKDEAIWSVSSAGGDERPVSGMSRLPPECSASWAVHASGIYYLEPGTRPGVMFLDYTKARVRRIADLPGAPDAWGGAAVSPDGRTLLFSRVEEVVSDIMLVEGFR